MSAQRVDAIVIGSGQGGVPFAEDLARSGKRVVLFERGRLGGSCINYGCTPSKAFLAAAHTGGRAARAAALGVKGHVAIDFPAVMERVRSIRDSFMAHVAKRLHDSGVRVIRSEAAFVGERTVRGGDETFTAPVIVIDTGTSANVPHVPGLEGTPYLTNATFFDLQALPQTLVVMGGGYIGLELGQGMARCGSMVHVIDSNPRVLAREETDASEALATSLKADGVQLHLRCRAKEVRYERSFTVVLDDGTTVRGDALLVAVGRQPNTAALDAPSGGIELDERGYVKIDAHLATTSAGVYAIGDVAGQPAFTHVSWEDFRRLKAIIAGEPRTRDDRVLAYSTYTEPQIARVGLTLDDAKRKGFRARAVTLPITHIARAIEWGQQLGFFRLVVDTATEKILGATMVGYETAELVHVVLAHMEAGSTWRVLERSVHIHPTYAEGLPSLARMLLS